MSDPECFFCCFFFFFNKVCVMPLSSVFFRGEDSTGNVLVCSILPFYNPLWFCSNRHILMWRSRAPRVTDWHHGNLLTRDVSRNSQEPLSSPPAVFGLLEELGLPLSSSTFLCSRTPERAAGTLWDPSWSQVHPPRCKRHLRRTLSPLPAQAASWQWPALSIHQC